MSRRRESELRRESTTPRRESIGRVNPRQVSISDPAPVPTVTVAVLPPRLASGLRLGPGLGPGPRTGVPAAGAFNWDEALNWRPSEEADEAAAAAARHRPTKPASKNPFKRAGLTTARQKANPDLPPFVMKQVPYETWRKHYAKDKDGNYKGTHAPAEDCLLRPHDVERWRLKGDGGDSPDAWAGRFTRGKEALPVYGEVVEEGMAPGYEADYDPNEDAKLTEEGNEGSTRDEHHPPVGEPTLEGDDGYGKQQQQPQQQAPPSSLPATPLGPGQAIDPNSGLPYDAQREREELMARNKGARRWKNAVKRGLETALLGGGTG
jgi:hypothetical protein